MDAPRHIELVTPNDDNILMIKMKDIINSDISSNNILYKLELGKSLDNSKIIFKIYDTKNILEQYLLAINIDEFYYLNIIFRIYKNIDEIFNILIDIINNRIIIENIH